MNAPSAEWVKTALEVTGHFEDSSDPLGAVTGDFDGMGISLGVLQWNIGSASLQPMVTAVGKDHVLALMPRHGEEFWQACNADIKGGLAICRKWQNGTQLRADIAAELESFTRSEKFVGQQVARAGKVAQSAFDAATRFAHDDPGFEEATKALFCWFFDVYTQNGGLKGLSYSDVDEFLRRNGQASSDDVICNWLAGRSKGHAGYKDSIANAPLWRNKVPAESLSLFILSYLRCQLSRMEYRADVMNRKATIAVGEGWVHREKHNLKSLLA